MILTLLEKFLSMRQYAANPSDWQITGKNYYATQVGIIRSKHPMAQQIRFKINQCLEFGIIEKWSRQVVGIYGLVFHSLITGIF